MDITKEIIKEHGLTAEEFEGIVEVLGRRPNLVELGIFSVMWSEHCSYKSSRVHLKMFPTTGPRVIQGPGENAGVVDIGDGLAAVFKMESHNHPSFIEPYQGAATGVGGILRDIFTMGARPVANLDSLRFGSLEKARTAYLLEGVVSGIAGYGNCMGVPTVGGDLYFNDCYNGNCLVNVMTAGVVKKDRIFKGRASGVGNPVVYVGSKTGRDGIHGATMASDVFGEGGEERRPTVQVGDPFTEKLLLEACLELFRTDHVVGIQDMGAAGLTSSSVEMASRGGCGIEMDIDRVPRREAGMGAYEVMLSESQERMLIVVKKGREEEVKKIFGKWDLECEVIGSVIEEKVIRVLEKGEKAAEIPIATLTDSAPVYERPAKRPSWQDSLTTLDISSVPLPADFNEVLLKIMTSGNMASRRWIYRQYDHMVRTDTVVPPGSDAAVIRIKGTDKALALTVDCNPVYCYLDPRRGAAIAVAEAARNLVASGAQPLALTDCLNFGSPERPEVMWQFKESIAGIRDACLALGIPVIGGNVSFYNETLDVAIHPTPTIGMLGLIEDLSHTTRQWFRQGGDVIALMGRGAPGLGGTEYLKTVHGVEKGEAPEIDLKAEKNIQNACLKAIRTGIILSAHDLSEGGVACAIAECCMGPGGPGGPGGRGGEGPVGARVELKTEGLRPDELLFGEAQSRIVVTLKEKDVEGLKEICASQGVPVEIIGEVGGSVLKVGGLIELPVAEIARAWEGSLERVLGQERSGV